MRSFAKDSHIFSAKNNIVFDNVDDIYVRSYDVVRLTMI